MIPFQATGYASRLFNDHIPRAVGALEHIATALSVLTHALTTPPAGDGPAPRTSTGGPVSVTVRGVRIMVEMGQPEAPPTEPVPEERCFATAYMAECEGTGHDLCERCANHITAATAAEEVSDDE